ncbi:hypothetical protein GCM10009869_05450 [Amnibacterium kyonggiense]
MRLLPNGQGLSPENRRMNNICPCCGCARTTINVTVTVDDLVVTEPAIFCSNLNCENHSRIDIAELVGAIAAEMGPGVR